jgi:hypothetical protein
MKQGQTGAQWFAGMRFVATSGIIGIRQRVVEFARYGGHFPSSAAQAAPCETSQQEEGGRWFGNHGDATFRVEL